MQYIACFSIDHLTVSNSNQVIRDKYMVKLDEWKGSRLVEGSKNSLWTIYSGFFLNSGLTCFSKAHKNE